MPLEVGGAPELEAATIEGNHEAAYNEIADLHMTIARLKREAKEKDARIEELEDWIGELVSGEDV